MFDYLKNFIENDQEQARVIRLKELLVELIADER